MGEAPTLHVGVLTDTFRFDGKINEPAWWAATDSIANLITIKPEEGGTPAGRTIIKVLANPNEIIVGALVVNTRKVDGIEVEEELEVDVPQTTMGAVRVKQNVPEESSVGLSESFSMGKRFYSEF